MIKKIKEILSYITHYKNYNPIVGCKLYKEEGCAHVDGPLCDYPNCKMLTKYLHKYLSPTHELLKTEIENYHKFIKKLPKKYKNKPIYFRFEYGSGIGVSTFVKCEDREEDITDYGRW